MEERKGSIVAFEACDPGGPRDVQSKSNGAAAGGDIGGSKQCSESVDSCFGKPGMELAGSDRNLDSPLRGAAVRGREGGIRERIAASARTAAVGPCAADGA